MEKFLSAALADFQVRNEVDESMQSMLLDIETTFHLQSELELHTTKKELERIEKERQGVILDAHAERLERYDRRLNVADSFVLDIVQVNQKLVELIMWKETHEHKVRNYDALLAKLAQTEEELREANRISFGGGAIPRRVVEEKKERTSEVLNSSASQLSNSNPEQTPENTLNKPEIETTRQATVTSISSEGLGDSNFTFNSTIHSDDKNIVEKNTDPPAALSIDDEADSKEYTPTLVNLDVEPLIEVFGFLDAMDILNLAQINITMYNKVDNIFGISEDGQSPPAPTNNSMPQNSSSETEPPKHDTTVVSPSDVKKSTTDTKSTLNPSLSGTSASSPSTGVIGAGLFSMLQPKPVVSEIPVSSNAVTNPTGNLDPGQQQKQQQPLNAKVAQSMASKLSDTELAAIISMTDKLSKLEKEVHMLRDEKEVFAAKLDGTEAVKQFLIGKVRDIELKLNRCKEDEIKVTQQIASDQEVVAFLDSRVQELEQQTEILTIDKTGTRADYDALKISTAKKIAMLSDMLKYEREKVLEDEGEWKATKKVLVKEVKSCRAQILALQAERDGFKEQNDMLKRAIVSPGSGGTSNKHNGGRKLSRSPQRRR